MMAGGLNITGFLPVMNGRISFAEDVFEIICFVSKAVVGNQFNIAIVEMDKAGRTAKINFLYDTGIEYGEGYVYDIWHVFDESEKKAYMIYGMTENGSGYKWWLSTAKAKKTDVEPEVHTVMSISEFDPLEVWEEDDEHLYVYPYTPQDQSNSHLHPREAVSIAYYFNKSTKNVYMLLQRHNHYKAPFLSNNVIDWLDIQRRWVQLNITTGGRQTLYDSSYDDYYDIIAPAQGSLKFIDYDHSNDRIYTLNFARFPLIACGNPWDDPTPFIQVGGKTYLAVMHEDWWSWDKEFGFKNIANDNFISAGDYTLKSYSHCQNVLGIQRSADGSRVFLMTEPKPLVFYNETFTEIDMSNPQSVDLNGEGNVIISGYIGGDVPVIYEYTPTGVKKYIIDGESYPEATKFAVTKIYSKADLYFFTDTGQTKIYQLVFADLGEDENPEDYGVESLDDFDGKAFTKTYTVSNRGDFARLDICRFISN